MDEILYGNAYDLLAVYELEDCQYSYLLEASYKSECGETCRVDLGMKRILEINRNSWLVIVKKNELVYEKIAFPENTNGEYQPIIKLSEIFKEKGINCRVSNDKYKDKNGWRNNPAWKNALDRRKGMFSKNGFALQYCGWLDCWLYNFDMVLMNKNWITIGGHDIERFFCYAVTKDIMNNGKKLIEKVLERSYSISEKEFAEQIERCGLWKEIEEISMVERS